MERLKDIEVAGEETYRPRNSTGVTQRTGSAARNGDGALSPTSTIGETDIGQEAGRGPHDARAPFKTCPGCGAIVTGGRPGRRYCGGRCRAQASRRRKAREFQALIALLGNPRRE